MGLKVILADSPEWLALFSFLYKNIHTGKSELIFLFPLCLLYGLLVDPITGWPLKNPGWRMEK